MSYTNGLDKPTDYFNTVLYTGNGSDGREVTGVGFQPDFVWIKPRSVASSHTQVDSVRGANGSVMRTIFSNISDAEESTTSDTNLAYGVVNAITSDGFTVGSGNTSDGRTNQSSATYCSWNWLAGGSASSNTDGSITSSVSANTTAGFSIVSYTGTEANATVGHGLGVAPNLIIFKNRGRSDGDWIVGGDSIHSSWEKFLYLSGTNASTDLNLFQDTAPTSSVFYLSGDGNINGTENIIAYCFAEKKGYSKFGSFTGNGNADGAFVYTGFKPAWVMYKKTNSADNWYMLDNKRNEFNVVNKYFDANTSDAEATFTFSDFLSNGIKFRDASANGSGDTYIYMAFAENPFVTSGGIPTTAR